RPARVTAGAFRGDLLLRHQRRGSGRAHPHGGFASGVLPAAAAAQRHGQRQLHPLPLRGVRRAAGQGPGHGRSAAAGQVAGGSAAVGARSQRPGGVGVQRLERGGQQRTDRAASSSTEPAGLAADRRSRVRMTARAVVLRVGAALVQVAVAAIAVFVLTALLPGDTAVVVLGEHADQQQLAALRAQLGLDDPLEQRFLNWVTGLLRGDLGVSLLTGAPVAEGIGRGLATTVLVAGATLLVLLPVAFATGVYCGLREDSRVAWAVNSLLLLLNAIPEFVLGLLLIGAVSVRAGWLPATAAGLSGWSLLSEPAVLV